MTRTLSVVVVAYDMARELPRTLRSLAPDYQRGIAADDYEVVRRRQRVACARRRGADRRVPRPDPRRTARPGTALTGAGGQPRARAGRGRARRAAHRRRPHRVARPAGAGPPRRPSSRPARRRHPRAGTSGRSLHMDAAGPATTARPRTSSWLRSTGRPTATGCSGSARWRRRPPGAGSDRWARATRCSSRRELWAELGGLDERFVLPGGGRVNHDLYRRACALDGAQLVVLLGEGTFHQTHGGAATSGRYAKADADAEYEALRGEPFAADGRASPPRHDGRSTALPSLEHSVQWVRRRA